MGLSARRALSVVSAMVVGTAKQKSARPLQNGKNMVNSRALGCLARSLFAAGLERQRSWQVNAIESNH